MTFCGNCGFKNPPETKYCQKCGEDISKFIPQQQQPRQDGIERLGAFDPQKTYTYQPMKTMPIMAPAPVMQQNGFQQQAPVSTAKYDSTGRALGCMLSLLAFAVAALGMFVIPVDFSDFDLNLLRFSAMVDQGAFIVLLVAVFAGLVSILMPVLNVFTGILMIVATVLGYLGQSGIEYMILPGLIVFVLLAVLNIVFGLVSFIFMKKYCLNNMKDVSVLKACYYAWVGTPRN